ncbi:MAG: deoxyhypusine synthase [Terriglobia bacterium]
MSKKKNQYLSGRKIAPSPLHPKTTLPELIDDTFAAYNAARLREACHLYTRQMLARDVTVGMSLSGALSPAGMGISTFIPLIEAGFVDWIVSTGANLYHDSHFGIGLDLHAGSPQISDVVLRQEGVVRIYDIFFDYRVLLSTDAFFRKIIRAPEFQQEMSSAAFHFLVGKYVHERERLLGLKKRSILAAAYRCGVPIYTSSPGDSSIGMNVAAMALQGSRLRIDVSADVNETAAIVLEAKRSGGKSAVFICGGGSPKNFILQTEPQLQEVLEISEKGHDYFLQVTDARPDTGGLSGATPSEAVSWGKIDPDQLPHSVVCYCDSTIAVPLIAAYALATHRPRKLKRLFDRRQKLANKLTEEFQKTRKKRSHS